MLLKKFKEIFRKYHNMCELYTVYASVCVCANSVILSGSFNLIKIRYFGDLFDKEYN